MSKLPSYRNPPVVEVALGVQFEPIEGFLAPHLGLIWNQWRSEFPKIEQHQALAPVIERLGARRMARSEVSVALRAGAETPRIWMLSDNGCDLVQVQQDHFLRNWRKYPAPDSEYPRYEAHIRPRFLQDFARFQQFLKANDLPAAKVNQCEVTYVNHVTAGKGWQSHSELGAVFVGWQRKFGHDWTSPLEAVGARFSKVIRDKDGEFLGRLNVQIDSAFTAPTAEDTTDTNIFAITLVARGRPTGQDEGGISGFLDRGRDEIVRMFDAITTDEMHKLWGKE